MAEDTPAADFPTPSMDDWRAAAEKALRGKPLDSVTWRTDDGFELPPVLGTDSASTPTEPADAGRPWRSMVDVGAIHFTGRPRSDVVDAYLRLGFDVALVSTLRTGTDAAIGSVRHLERQRAIVTTDDTATATDLITSMIRDGIEQRVQLGGGPYDHDTADAIGVCRDLLSTLPQWTESERSEVLCRMAVPVVVDSHLLRSAARVRAARRVLREQLESVGVPRPDADAVWLYAVPETVRQWSVLDVHNVLLRGALGGFGAAAGGADAIGLLSLEAIALPGTSTARLAAQLHMLRDEAHLTRVADPLAGSYVAERLTNELAERLRSEVGGDRDRKGAFTQPDAVRARAREPVLVGVNRFVDPHSRDHRLEDETSRHHIAQLDSAVGFENAAPSTPFEWLQARARTADERPRALLLPVGDPRVRRARADFAADFFRCGGFDIDDPVGFASIDDALADVGEARVIVVCASDDLVAAVTARVRAAAPNADLYVAGRPAERVDAEFVFEGVDAVAVLANALDRLGIDRLGVERLP